MRGWLRLHPAKTRLIRFGRHAAKQRESRGEGKPETFDFLGFTHFCTRSHKWGSFVIGRKTIRKRMRAKLKAIKTELRKRMHDPVAETGAWVKQMLQGIRTTTPSRVITRACGGSAIRCGGPGSGRFGDEARRPTSPGSASSASSIASFRQSRHYIRCPVTVSTPKPEGGARCVSSARRDLGGGRGPILVPTATLGLKFDLDQQAIW